MEEELKDSVEEEWRNRVVEKFRKRLEDSGNYEKGLPEKIAAWDIKCITNLDERAAKVRSLKGEVVKLKLDGGYNHEKGALVYTSIALIRDITERLDKESIVHLDNEYIKEEFEDSGHSDDLYFGVRKYDTVIGRILEAEPLSTEDAIIWKLKNDL